MNIEDKLFPNNGELIINKEEYTATCQLIDAELDPINCSFANDSCVTINTKGLDYIVLSLENLETLQELIFQTEAYFNENAD